MGENNGKLDSLLQAAYQLFSDKGVHSTTIDDIVREADVAKGTFYLYFKDKYDLQEQLVIRKSYALFQKGIDELQNLYISHFEDQVIFVINYVLDALIEEPNLIALIDKDLSLGVYHSSLSKIMSHLDHGFKSLFMQGLETSHIQLKNPDVTFFMIMELVSSTCVYTIIKGQPLPICDYKSYLYDTIRMLIKMS